MGRTRVLPLLLAVLAASGCDSTDDLVLDADFYVGTWTLVRVADDSGDLTSQIDPLLDDLTVAFASDRSFELDADFSAAAEALGQTDVAFDGTYQAAAAARTLTLLVDLEGTTLAPTFRVDAETEDDVTLTAPGAIVSQLLGDLPLDFDGDVVLEVTR